MFISFKSLLSSKHEDLKPLTNLFRTPLIACCGTRFAVANLSRTTKPKMEISMFQELRRFRGTGLSLRGRSQAP